MHQRNQSRDESAGDGGATRTTTGRRRFVRALGTGAVAAAGLAGTVGGQETTVVSMASDYFDPIGLAVEPGTTVRFEIVDGSHSATAYADRIPDGAAAFDSGVVSSGSFEHTFGTPGTYDYYCIPHRSAGMVGRIVVGDPGGPAQDSPIPDGAVPDGETIVAEGSVGVDEFEESADGRGGRRGRGMGPGGRMPSGGPGWMVLVPAGVISTLLGLVGGVAYWAGGRDRAGTDERPDSDRATERRDG